jgi:hypothetical protein
MDDKRKTAMNRRGFFGAVAGASAAAAAGAATFSPTAAEAYDPGEQERKARYRETEHVKAFYRVNGYQTLKK